MARPRVEEYVIDLLVASSLLLPLLLPFIAADILLLYYYGGRGCYLDTDRGIRSSVIVTVVSG